MPHFKLKNTASDAITWLNGVRTGLDCASSLNQLVARLIIISELFLIISSESYLDMKLMIDGG